MNPPVAARRTAGGDDLFSRVPPIFARRSAAYGKLGEDERLP
jgi:hypothetical protein